MDASQQQHQTLADLDIDESGIITAISLTGPQRRRLFDLGFIPGTPVTAVMRAALGSPLAYRVRGAVIALRPDQAAEIQITTEATETTTTEVTSS